MDNRVKYLEKDLDETKKLRSSGIDNKDFHSYLDNKIEMIENELKCFKREKELLEKRVKTLEDNFFDIEKVIENIENHLDCSDDE